MILAFVAAGIGNLIRTKLIKHHFTLFLNIAVSISASCFIYAAFLKIAEMAFNVPSIHEAGYICSMLFIIPGFPFITSGIDLAKLDLRSGLERLAYAIIIVMVATMFAWIMALLLRLQPMDFEDLNLTPVLHLILRLIMSFFGVFGFSIMFNSPAPMAATAALIGAIANSLRLELVDLTGMPAPAAAFAGAHSRASRFIYQGKQRISENIPYCSIHSHNGSGTLSVSCYIQFRHNGTFGCCFMVCISNHDYHCTAARTHLCKNTN